MKTNLILITLLTLSLQTHANIVNCSYVKTIGFVSTKTSGFANKFKALKAACAKHPNSDIVYTTSGAYLCQVGIMCNNR